MSRINGNVVGGCRKRYHWESETPMRWATKLSTESGGLTTGFKGCISTTTKPSIGGSRKRSTGAALHAMAFPFMRAGVPLYACPAPVYAIWAFLCMREQPVSSTGLSTNPRGARPLPCAAGAGVPIYALGAIPAAIACMRARAHLWMDENTHVGRGSGCAFPFMRHVEFRQCRTRGAAVASVLSGPPTPAWAFPLMRAPDPGS